MLFKTVKGQNRLDDVFQGFKHFVMPEELIEEDAQSTWTEVRSIMSEKRLATVPVLKKDGTQRLTPKTRIPMYATNLPKSKEYTFFLRGTSSDALNKNVQINDVRIYRQNIWIKGKTVVALLNEPPVHRSVTPSRSHIEYTLDKTDHQSVLSFHNRHAQNPLYLIESRLLFNMR